MKIKRLNISISTAILCATVFLYLLGSYLFIDINSSLLTKSLSFMILAISITCIIVLVKETKNVLNQYSLFLISFFLFSFGQVYLYVFNLSYEKFDVMKKYSCEMINKYLIFSIISLISMCITLDLLKNNTTQSHEKPSDCVDKTSVVLVFKALLIVSAPFYFYGLFDRILIAREFGYGEIYNQTGSLIVELMSMFFLPSIIALIYCNKNNKKKYFYLFLVILPIIGYLYVGARGKSMSILMCLLFLWGTGVKKYTKKNIVFLTIGVIGMMILISTIAEVRSEKYRTMSEIIIKALNTGIKDGVINTFGEFGGSMQIWIRLQNIVPEKQSYSLGFSYIASILSCIPSFLLGGFSFAKYSNLSNWITNIEKTNYGLGFSMLGEAFYNFGWFGSVFFGIVIGFIFYMLSGNWVPKNIKPYKIIFSTFALYIFAGVGRSSMYLAFRYIVYCMLVPILLIIVIDKQIKTNVTNSTETISD